MRISGGEKEGDYCLSPCRKTGRFQTWAHSPSFLGSQFESLERFCQAITSMDFPRYFLL